MANSLKKRGQKFVQKFSRASIKASEEGKEHIKENLVDRVSHIKNVRLLIFEWGLLVFALIMLATAQAFWFGDSYAEDSFTDGGTYTEATIGDVNSMNPLFATTNSERVLSKLMFATIATIDYSGHPGNQLAKSIVPDENGKRWVVEMKEGLKWSDGEPITNDDVIFTAELIKNPAVNTIYEANLSNVKVSKGENGEVIFDLPTSYADFMSALNIPVVPKHVLENTDPKTLVENSFSNSPITSGAFSYNALQTNPGNNEKVFYLSANLDYFQGRPLLNSFAVHTFANKDEIVNAVNSGSVSATAELSDAEADRIGSKQFYKKDSSLNAGAFVFFNLKRDWVKEKDFRAAVRQGINQENIRAAAPDTIALNYPLLKTQIPISTYPEIPATDTEAAKSKIAELSEGNPIHLEIATVNSGYLPDVANSIAEELKNLGVEADVVTYDENQDFITNVIAKRSYDILVYEIELGAEPDLLPYYHSSQTSTAGLNLSNYRNNIVDDLLLGARDTLDEALRVKKYESFLDYWVSDVPAIGLYQSNMTYYYNKNVRTYSNDVKIVTPIDRFIDVTEWAVNKTTKNKTP